MMTLLLFGAGHLMVVVIAFLFIRILRRQPDLLARRESIFELNSKPVRIEAGEAELAAARTEAAGIDRCIAETKTKIADAVPLDDPPSTMVAYALLGGILAEAEAGVVWLLSGPVKFLSLSTQAWGFAAPLFAAAWIVLLHVLIGWAVADKHRPARTIRRAKVGAGLCGVAVIIGAWMTLAGRNLTDTAVIEQLAGAGLMVLAGLLSVCAAFCTLVATTLLEAQHHERQLARLESLHNSYMRHIEMIEKDLARLKKLPDAPDTPDTPAAPVAQPPNTPATASAAAPAGVIPTMLIALGLIGLSGVMHAQSATRTATVTTEAPSRASAPAFARIGACEFLPDVSSSVDRAPLQTTLDQTAAKMSVIADTLNCSVIRLTPFAGDLFVSIDEFNVPGVSDPVSRCQTAPPAAISARSQALGFLYPDVAASHQQQAVDACLLQNQRMRQDQIAQRHAAIDKIASGLRAMGKSEPRGPCTALPQAVQRALQRSQHVITLTDGVPTCTPPATIAPVPADGHLLFLLVPPGGPGAADRANLLLDRLTALERAFQGSRALLAPEATPTFWQRLVAK
jgi:hypothetical protein